MLLGSSDNFRPTIAAAATILLATVEWLRRRSERLALGKARTAGEMIGYGERAEPRPCARWLQRMDEGRRKK
jgi:hypothetical protein